MVGFYLDPLLRPCIFWALTSLVVYLVALFIVMKVKNKFKLALPIITYTMTEFNSNTKKNMKNTSEPFQ